MGEITLINFRNNSTSDTPTTTSANYGHILYPNSPSAVKIPNENAPLLPKLTGEKQPGPINGDEAKEMLTCGVSFEK